MPVHSHNDLPRCECGDSQHQRRVTGLYNNSGEDADCREQQHTGIAGYRKLSQIERLLIGFESILHKVDAKKQKTQPGENIAYTLERLGGLKIRITPNANIGIA